MIIGCVYKRTLKNLVQLIIPDYSGMKCYNLYNNFTKISKKLKIKIENMVIVMSKNNVDVYDVVTRMKGDDEVIPIRQIMFLRLLKVIPELENKILNGRIKDKETEKIRLEYFKVYINACNCINNFTKGYSYNYEKDKLMDFLDVDDIVENSE